MDWDRYRIQCARERQPVLQRFQRTLLEGAGRATMQSAPVYTGMLTAMLITIFRQMEDARKEKPGGFVLNHANGSDAGREDRQTGVSCSRTEKHDRLVRKERYFRQLAGIDRLEIAKEYLRTHFQCQSPDTEEIYAWLFSYQGRRAEAELLIREIDETIDRFILAQVPGPRSASKGRLTLITGGPKAERRRHE